MDQLLCLGFPGFCLCNTTARIFIQRDVVSLNQFRICFLDKVRIVLCAVFAGFRDIVPKLFHQFKTYHIIVIIGSVEFRRSCVQDLSILRIKHSKLCKRIFNRTSECAALDFGVVVLTVAGNLQKPCHVVNTSNLIIHAILGKIETPKKHWNTGLMRVAQTNSLNIGITVPSKCQHRHWICIIDEQRIGANLFHISCKSLHNWDCTQCAENATNTICVTNRLPQTIFFRHFKVCNRAGIVAANLNRIANIFCTAQSFQPIRIFHDFCFAAIGISVDVVKHHVGFFQTHRINIEQRVFVFTQAIRLQAVPKDVFSEYTTPCAKKCDFVHSDFSFMFHLNKPNSRYRLLVIHKRFSAHDYQRKARYVQITTAVLQMRRLR